MGYAIGFMVYYWGSLIGAAFEVGPTPVLARLASALPVAAGIWAAHRIADNLWLAYGQLSVRANLVMFVFLVFGFLWAFFFVQMNDLFPTPQMQVLLRAIATCVAALLAMRTRLRGFSVHDP